MLSDAIHSFAIVLLVIHMSLFLLVRLGASIPKPLFIVIALILMVIPVNELPILYYMRAFFGNLSLLTMVYCAQTIGLYCSRSENTGPERNWLAYQGSSHLILVGVGMLLYPTALGLGPIDLYALGYGSGWMIWISGGLLLLSLKLRATMLFYTWCCAILFFMMGVFESNNLWDYLVDPVICFIALVKWIRGVRYQPPATSDVRT